MIVAGIGCRRGCDARHIIAIVARAEVAASCRVEALATTVMKRAERGVIDAARELALPVLWITKVRLADAQARCTASAVVLRHTGVGSIAEAAALAAAGDGARLILRRIASDVVTCALARGDSA